MNKEQIKAEQLRIAKWNRGGWLKVKYVNPVLISLKDYKPVKDYEKDKM